MKVRISRKAIEASWPEDCNAPEVIREVVNHARRTGVLDGTRVQLERVCHELDALASAWFNDGQAENRGEAKMMLRAADTIDRALNLQSRA